MAWMEIGVGMQLIALLIGIVSRCTLDDLMVIFILSDLLLTVFFFFFAFLLSLLARHLSPVSTLFNLSSYHLLFQSSLVFLESSTVFKAQPLKSSAPTPMIFVPLPR